MHKITYYFHLQDCQGFTNVQNIQKQPVNCHKSLYQTYLSYDGMIIAFKSLILIALMLLVFIL